MRRQFGLRLPWYRQWGIVMRRCGWPLAVAIASALIVLFFFCPRFAVWRGIDFEPAWGLSEVNRAVDSLKQVDAPFTATYSPSNQVIAWRLMFPLLGHYTGMPRLVFLSLPFVGCLLTLAIVAALSQRELGDRWTSAVLTCGTATTSWFFSSTGWLAYFDSWAVLGLFVYTALPGRFALLATALALPWIDERTFLSVPLCLLLRRGVLRMSWRALAGDAGMIALGAMPYLLVRLIALFQGDDSAVSYFSSENWRHVRPWMVVLGILASVRAMWILVAVGIWRYGSEWGRRSGILLATTALLTLVALASIAADVSRSLSVFTCAAWAGAVFLARFDPMIARRTIYGVVLANLLLPAAHIVSVWSEPYLIPNLYTQLWIAGSPEELSAARYFNQGTNAMNEKKMDSALKSFNLALSLDPQLKEALIARAVVSIYNNDFASACDDANAVLAQTPKNHEALYIRGRAEEGLGEKDAAQRDYRASLDTAPDDWASRTDCFDRWARLRWSE